MKTRPVPNPVPNLDFKGIVRYFLALATFGPGLFGGVFTIAAGLRPLVRRGRWKRTHRAAALGAAWISVALAGMAPLQAGDPPISVTVSCSTNSVIISWPAPSDGWQLQENADLNTTNWTDLLTGVQEVGARKQVILLPPAGNQFFRLQRQ